jgi:DNA replication and repair protein RecF
LILKSSYLKNVRNYRKRDVTFHDEKNLLIGNSSQGKTNLLEAIHVLCSLNSQRGSRDVSLIREGQFFYHIKGNFSTSCRNALQVSVSSSIFHQKKITINDRDDQQPSNLMRRIGIVTLSSEDGSITQGSPYFRRQYVDTLLSKKDRTCVFEVSECRRVIPQRKRLLRN